MRATKLFLVALALVGLAAASASGQVIAEFSCDRDNGNNSAGGCVGLYPAEGHSNQGGASNVRIKASDHQYYADWSESDLQEIETILATYQCPPGQWLEVKLCAVVAWGTPPAGRNTQIAAVWSETDWVENDGPQNYTNYNWSNTATPAATYTFAQNIENPLAPGTPDPAAVPWVSPVIGPCTFLGTFLMQGDKCVQYGHGWSPWLNIINSIGNSQTIPMTTADEGSAPGAIIWTCATLDMPLVMDLIGNTNNRGLVLYNLPPEDFYNAEMYTREQWGGEAAPKLVIECVPEPASLLLLGIGGVGLLLRRKRS